MTENNPPPSGLDTMHKVICELKNYHLWVFSRIKPFLQAPILEIGPGWGQLSAFLIREKYEYYAIDNDFNVIKRLKSVFAKHNHRFINDDIFSPSFINNLSIKPNTIIMLNVLEHIETDAHFLTKLHNLFPNSSIVIQVPAMPFIYGNMDKQAGHFRRYSMHSIRKVVETANYRISDIFYFNAIGAITWFISTKIIRLNLKGQKTEYFIRFNDKFIIPISQKIDFLLNRLFGQSIILLGN